MITPNLIEAKKRTNNKVEIIDKEYIIPESLKELGKDKLYFVKTYGCQMNEHDGENIKAILEQMSYKETNTMEEADLILLNTCAIRENAQDKVFGMIGRIKHLKETRKDVIAGICGCMAQEEEVVNTILKKFKWLDIVFGTHNINNLPNIINNSIIKNSLEVEVYSVEGNIIENIPVKRESIYKAWINIMYGCDKFCTYCIVPYTRGKQRSRLPEYIIKEVNELIKDGYKEVTLLGQNVNAYGKDLDINYTMEDLLEDVAHTGIERVRFVTSHPWDFSDKMIDVIKNNKNIMPYIHLPLQSGSDRILKLMGRKYTKEDYITLYKKIKKALPYSSITTDIIVGFPNETEEDFDCTLEVVNECKFDGAFTFIFSPRNGTPASRMEDSVSMEDKNRRLQTLQTLINKYSKEANDYYLDKVVPVLIEDIARKNKETMVGFTDTMKLVNIKLDESLIRTVQNVKITSVKTWSMNGEIVK